MATIEPPGKETTVMKRVKRQGDGFNAVTLSDRELVWFVVDGQAQLPRGCMEPSTRSGFELDAACQR